MTTAATSLLGLALPVTGELSGTWGDTVNTSITSLLDSAVAGTTTLSADADVTLTTTTLAANQAREAIILWTASGTATRYITAPAQSKTYVVLNKSSTQSIVLRGAGPTTGVTVLAGKQAMVAWDGTDFVEVSSGYVDGPASSTDNAVARFDGTDGKTIQNSVVIIADTTGNMSGVGTLSSGAITSSSLTSGRVLYAGTSGLIQDDADLTFNGTILTSTGFAGPLNGTVGATTPTTGAFTNVTASGTVISGSGTTTLTMGNAAGYAALSAGTAGLALYESSQQAVVFSSLTALYNYKIQIQDTTASTTTTTGALRVAGGAGIVGNLNVGGTASVAGGVTLSGGTANGVAYLDGSKVLTTGTALTFDGTKLVTTATTGATTTYPAYFDNSGGGAGTGTRIGFRNTGTSYGEIGYLYDGVFAAIIDSANSTNTRFLIGGTQQMILTSSGLEVKQSQLIGYSSYAGIGTNGLAVAGNVGIGTSSPAYKLDVNGAANASFVRVSGGSGAGTSTGLLDFSSGNTRIISAGANSGAYGGLLIYRANAGVADAQLTATFDSAGNLGLGVTPSAWGSGFKAIDISGYGSSVVALTSGPYTWVGSNWYNNGTNDLYVVSNSAALYRVALGAHAWFIAPSGTAGNPITFTQAMTLDASGNWILGGTTPIAKGTIVYPGGGTQYGLALKPEADTTISILFQNAAGTSVGSISQTSTITVYNTASDYRLKTVIGAVADSGSRIDALQPVEYTWNADGSRTRGFLAHQFQEVYAGSVTGTKDAVDAEGKPVYQAMQASTSEVIADLVAEIQSLRKRLAAAGI